MVNKLHLLLTHADVHANKWTSRTLLIDLKKDCAHVKRSVCIYSDIGFDCTSSLSLGSSTKLACLSLHSLFASFQLYDLLISMYLVSRAMNKEPKEQLCGPKETETEHKKCRGHNIMHAVLQTQECALFQLAQGSEHEWVLMCSLLSIDNWLSSVISLTMLHRDNYTPSSVNVKHRCPTILKRGTT